MAAAFNIVRFRVKPGNEQAFIDAHRKARPAFKGFLHGHLVKTGEQTLCMVGEWRNFQSLAAARPEMISILDEFRHLLEDLGGGSASPTRSRAMWSQRSRRPRHRANAPPSARRRRSAP